MNETLDQSDDWWRSKWNTRPIWWRSKSNTKSINLMNDRDLSGWNTRPILWRSNWNTRPIWIAIKAKVKTYQSVGVSWSKLEWDWIFLHTVLNTLCHWSAWVHLQRGCVLSHKDPFAAKHPEIEMKNLLVMKVLTSLKSVGYVREQFAWRHYNTGTLQFNEGIL